MKKICYMKIEKKTKKKQLLLSLNIVGYTQKAQCLIVKVISCGEQYDDIFMGISRYTGQNFAKQKS